MGAFAHKPQTQLLDENQLNDAALERQLVERHRRQQQLGEYRKTFKEIDDTVKGRINELRIKGNVRVGGFIISVKTTAGRSVEFETKPHKTIRIRPVKEEQEND